MKERADAARNRLIILKAARKLLKRTGGHLCMDALVEEAGVGKGTLYRRFPDRAAVVHAVLDEDSRALQSWALGGCGLDASARHADRALALFGGVLDFNFDHASLLCEAHRDSGPDLDHPAYVWQRHLLAGHLRRAMRAGEIAQLDPVLTAELMLAGASPERLLWLAKESDPGALRREVLGVWRRILR